MESIKRIAKGVLIAVLVFAVGFWWINDERDKKQAAAERQQRSVQKIQQAEPTTRTFYLPGGQLMTVDVPAPMQGIPTIMEVQRCYVWRDDRGPASISCSTPPAMNLDN